MKNPLRLLSGCAATALLVLFAACLRDPQQKPTLHLFTWSDYLDPQLVRRFEQDFQCRVVID